MGNPRPYDPTVPWENDPHDFEECRCEATDLPPAHCHFCAKPEDGHRRTADPDSAKASE